LRFVSATVRQQVDTARIAATAAIDQEAAAGVHSPQLQALAQAAQQALAALKQAMDAAVNDIAASWNQIQIPASEPASANTSAAQIASELPRYEYGRRAYGALVVKGRIYW